MEVVWNVACIILIIYQPSLFTTFWVDIKHFPGMMLDIHYHFVVHFAINFIIKRKSYKVKGGFIILLVKYATFYFLTEVVVITAM